MRNKSKFLSKYVKDSTEFEGCLNQLHFVADVIDGSSEGESDESSEDNDAQSGKPDNKPDVGKLQASANVKKMYFERNFKRKGTMCDPWDEESGWLDNVVRKEVYLGGVGLGLS